MNVFVQKIMMDPIVNIQMYAPVLQILVNTEEFVTILEKEHIHVIVWTYGMERNVN
uniref:Uncharacterized protein n=1 Tax=Acrobeloides nanus TaxID=290746 RepID=A0A914C6G6_9BILA